MHAVDSLLPASRSWLNDRFPVLSAKPKSLSWLYGSLVVSIGFATLLVVATIWFSALGRAANELVRHTLAVRYQIARVLTLVQSAESGQRGFLLTGRGTYLAPYEQAIQELPSALDELGGLVTDNPVQQQSVGRMRQLTTDKLRELRRRGQSFRGGYHDFVIGPGGVEVFIAASFGSAAGFACGVGARFQSLVGLKVERWSRA
jgi:hypothetical protein